MMERRPEVAAYVLYGVAEVHVDVAGVRVFLHSRIREITFSIWYVSFSPILATF